LREQLGSIGGVDKYCHAAIYERFRWGRRMNGAQIPEPEIMLLPGFYQKCEHGILSGTRQLAPDPPKDKRQTL